MCNARTSMAREPRVGYLANVGYRKTADNHAYEQWMVTAVAEDLEWAEVRNGYNVMIMTRPWYATAWQNGDGPAIYEGARGIACTFTRIPEPRDRGYSSDDEGRLKTFIVERVESDGRIIFLAGGEIVRLQPWGTYVMTDGRGVDFYPHRTRRRRRVS